MNCSWHTTTNGLVECIKKSILEQVRCMLWGFELPRSFWGKYFWNVTLFNQKCLSTCVGFKTPMDVCIGKLVEHSHLNAFRAFEFMHIKQDNLDVRYVK